MIQLPNSLLPVIDTLILEGYRPIVVGGYVRDTLLDIPSKDIDIEVFLVEDLTALQKVLSPFGSVNSVGKSFGVLKFKHEGLEVDFSIPRQETKVAEGHKGFEVRLNANVSFEEAALRRDFTINAMGYDIKAKQLLDPFNGKIDLEKRRLNAVNAETFVEDPLRVYRAIQFAARFELTLSSELHALLITMVRAKMLDTLPKERVFEEFKKLFLKSKKPSIGLKLMDELGVLSYFPELKALKGVPQDPTYHPEGDVWVHTLMVVDAMKTLFGEDEKENLILMLAALCHDLGKANTTQKKDGRIRAIGHEVSGMELSEQFLMRLSDEKSLIEAILPLVKHHLKPMQFYQQGGKSAAIRRLATQVNISQLILLAEADFLGRTTVEALAGDFEAGRWLSERAASLKVSERPLEPLLQGRDLIEVGMKPSKMFKVVLDKAYEVQLEGKITTHKEAVAWLQKSDLLALF